MIDAVVLGLFTGLTYGLLAVGLVLVYRSSRFVNFAHGSVGVFGAAVLGKVVTAGVLPYWVAFPLAMVAAGAVAAAIEVVVVRRLRHRPAVTGMIATLGLSQFILIAALLLNSQGLSGLTFPRPPGLPTFTLGRTPIGPAFVAMALLAPVLFGALALLLRRSRVGLGLRAAADAPDMARLDGVPAARMTTLAWAVAGAVAAFSAILVTPTQGAQSIDTLGPELLLRGLAGAVAARMSSLPRALAACLGIGVAERVLLSWGAGRGGVSLALALFILVTLLCQPRLGRRDSGQAGWPRSVPQPGTVLGRVVTALGLLAAAGLAYLVSNETASVLTTVAGFALVGLSVLLVTGLAGELSLGQFAFAGIGAAVSLHVAAVSGNFFTAALAGCAAAAVAAALVGLPALRLRGLALAAVSLAFALAAEGWLLRLPVLLGDGVEAAKPQWHGYPLLLAKDYYLFALLMLGLGLWLAHRLRTGGFGLTVLALRDNEDAAKALAVPATLRKLQVYAAAGVLAGLGGVVIAHGQTQVTVNSFPASAGIDAVALTVVGGLGVLGGPLLGALLLVGLPALVDLGIGGQAALTVGWLLVVVLLPGGLGEPPARLLKRLPSRARNAELSTSDSAALVAEPQDRPLGAGGAAFPGSRAAVDGTAPARVRLPSFEVPVGGTALLSARAVARSFGGVRAVAGVDLDVAAGEVVGIIGPNGAGKTTLFEILAGYTRPDAGRVLLAGHDVTRLPPQRRARRGLGRSFQDARLFPTLTVRESLQVAGQRRHPTGLAAAALGATAGQRHRAARTGDLLDLFGLVELADRSVAALSTGTRRTVELACLLALEPALLLLDEPSSGVSQADGVALGELLLRVNRELGVALVVIEHDLPLLARLAPRLVAMESGRVIADGPTASVRAHPAVVASYLGTDPVAEHRSGIAV
ncbi:ABC transporter permease subunit [Catellatospora tritici]|uniref:ABC transporter permease subunit n=1 Tax=Catellatospora tritici TaxID=2851566 RepID=UPI001C2D8936|nr:ATP-binding cassette domain-containing protein [Catellatospora tritici]MBV1852669.1 ATP-binding cassette domain-containing protein [Catellatospora tritici]